MARYYVGSRSGAPTATAAKYVAMAEKSLAETQTLLDGFLATELADFERAVRAAGIGLFSSVAQP